MVVRRPVRCNRGAAPRRQLPIETPVACVPPNTPATWS
jgi:hypothetical protein